MKNFVAPATFLFILVSTLELLVRMRILNSSLVPAPSDVARILIEMHLELGKAFSESLFNSAIGFILSSVGGFTVACIFSLSDLLKRALLPFAVFFQTVPIVAIAPLLVIYFGFGSTTVIAASFIVSVFPVIASTLVGLESASTSLSELFSIYQARRWEKLWYLQVPSAFNSIYAGAKIAAGLSIVGAVAGEFVAGGGLGAMIDSARTQQRVDIVYACLLLLSVQGLVYLILLGCLRRGLLRWRPWI